VEPDRFAETAQETEVNMTLSMKVLLIVYAIILIGVFSLGALIPIRPLPNSIQGLIFAMLFGPLLIWVCPFAPWQKR
jgi:hypothetical protein